jgi:hypothetical protein
MTVDHATRNAAAAPEAETPERRTTPRQVPAMPGAGRIAVHAMPRPAPVTTKGRCTCGGRGGLCPACRARATAEARGAYFDTPPPQLSGAPFMVQRAPAEGAAPTSEPAPAGGGLLIEDDAAPAPGKRKKSDFLATVKQQICAAVDSELAAVGRSSAGCPYVEFWLAFYGGRTAAQIERALLRYAPSAAGAQSACVARLQPGPGRES